MEGSEQEANLGRAFGNSICESKEKEKQDWAEGET